MLPSRSRLGLSGLGSSQDLGSSNGDLYYNSRPEGHWSYQPPPPPVITHQPKPSTTQHFQPYERGYPKTLESLAEKVSLCNVLLALRDFDAGRGFIKWKTFDYIKFKQELRLRK